MKKILFLFFSIIFLTVGIVLIPFSKAQDTSCDMSNVQNACGGNNGFGSACQDLLKQCEATINQALQSSINATTPLQSRLNSLNTQIKGIKNTVSSIEFSLSEKRKQIDQGYKEMEKQQNILNQTIRDYYIKSYYNSPLVIFLSANSASEFTQILGYQKANADRDKAIITNIVITIQDLENKKKDLEVKEISLSSLKANLDAQSAQLDKIVSGAKAYQSTLTNQLSQLNSIQQGILSTRLNGLNIPLYAYNTQGGCSSDVGKDPGFSPKFGFFSYGVPNRVGLNQYGAKARAEAGQNAEQILKAYYNADYTTGYNTGINIHVVGSNEYGQSFDDNWGIEEYLKHVYEVPAAWPSESLKAQAIAARSYALSKTNNGASSICPSQSCQVVKREENSDSWKQAVSDTAGIVMSSGGNPITAWFSSTHGGYVHSSADIGWSGTSFTKNAQDSTGAINSFSDLNSNAYDKNSPWFYCDWGSRADYNKTAWLKSSEAADIVNVLLLAQKDSGTTNHLYQVDKPNPAGTDTWDGAKVRQELSSRGVTPYSSIDSISISADFGSGKTSSVSVSGDGQSTNFSGSDFKNYFNLRAPASIQIVGPLYNVER